MIQKAYWKKKKPTEGKTTGTTQADTTKPTSESQDIKPIGKVEQKTVTEEESKKEESVVKQEEEEEELPDLQDKGVQ